MSAWSELALNLLEILSPALLALLGWASVKLSKWLHAKAGNELIGGLLARLNDTAITAVRAIEQTAVKEIKAAKDPKSPGGSKITKEEAEGIKKAALGELKSYWGTKGLSSLGKVLGLDENGLGSLLAGKIESAVHSIGEKEKDREAVTNGRP